MGWSDPLHIGGGRDLVNIGLLPQQRLASDCLAPLSYLNPEFLKKRNTFYHDRCYSTFAIIIYVELP